MIVGSDAKFGGRYNYYSQHGYNKILDLKTAYSDGIVEDGYHVWWGFEDLHLFDYAKKELNSLYSSGKPFNLTMLTADTHHVGGYKCSKCNNKYEENYFNAISCSSAQVYDFISWLQKQDFYENTTIVISGDHNSMDSQFFKNLNKSYVRRIYNCFINSAVSTTNNKNREIVQFDMFPTTLAAMGIEIEGNKLGLGVNLFSDSKTLAERLGKEGLNKELGENSKFYKENFF